MKKFKIKVCGLRNRTNLAEICRLKPDFVGFIYYPGSPRHIGNMPVNVLSQVPEGVLPVLITVDMPEARLLELADKYGFRYLQLHGHESKYECTRLRDHGYFVIKAIPVKDADSLQLIKEYEGVVDLLILDTASEKKGGSGQKFDWTLISLANVTTDFLLSGGIAPSDAGIVKHFFHPHCVGVDINSRFEIVPGIKSVPLVQNFMKEILSED